MKQLRLLLPPLAAALLLVACGGDGDKKPSTPPIADITAAPPPAVTATPVSGGTFAPGPSVRLDELQGFAWQREGAGLLAYSRRDVQLVDAAGAARSVYSVAGGEVVLGVA